MSGLFLYGLCRVLGVRVTSFYRTPEHNVQVGGVATSLHLSFRAADIGLETPEPVLKLFEFLGFKVLRNDHGTHHHIEATTSSDIFFSGASLAHSLSDLHSSLRSAVDSLSLPS